LGAQSIVGLDSLVDSSTGTPIDSIFRMKTPPGSFLIPVS
jgi:hypothetical protein